jgi:hypothetical protein
MSDYAALAELIAGDFREVLADRTLKGEERITALVEVVGRLHENLAGVDFNGVNMAIESVEWNDVDAVVNIDANGRIESVDCTGADLRFWA